MTLVKWTENSFVTGATHLVDAFQKHSNTETQFELNKWQVCKSSSYTKDNSIYLRHPTWSRTTTETIADDENAEYDDVSVNEDNLWHDLQVSTTNTKNSNDAPEYLNSEWQLSIVYSHTWMCPVLYFTVQTKDSGNPWTRSQVVQYLQSINQLNNNNNHDSWDFVSMDEHPITGVPSFFLHPCQTLDRMQLLAQNNDPKNNIDDDDDNSAVMLLAWMSLILQSVGCSMPPSVYQILHAELCNDD